MGESARSSTGYRTAAVAVSMAVLLGLVVAAPRASAATACVLQGGSAVATLDESGDTVRFRMRSGVLYVNGVSCGSPDRVSIRDGGQPSDDRVIIDLTEPFPGGFIGLSLRSRDSTDIITIAASRSRDVVGLHGPHLMIETPGVSGSELDITVPYGAELRVKLRGGNDRFRMLAGAPEFAGRLTVRGGTGNDNLSGGPYADRLFGGPGKDKLRGRGGDDTLRGNSGRDVIRGGPGNDTIVSGRGADNVRGGKGTDTCKCGASDTVRGVN